MLQKNRPLTLYLSERTWFNTPLQRGEDVVQQNRSHDTVDRDPDPPARTEIWTEHTAHVR